MDIRLYTLSVLSCFSSVVMGQSFPSFEDVDTSGDGVLDPEEAAAVATLDFEAADTDQDGLISIQEYTVAAKSPKPPTFLIVE